MLAPIVAEKDHQTLHFIGALDCHTLRDVWQKKGLLSTDIKEINVAQLTRVDSSGLAFLAYFCIEYSVKLIDINPQLKTLIELYNLESVVF